MSIDFALLIALVGAVGSAVAIIRGLHDRRLYVMAQGAKEERLLRLRDDLDRAHEKIRVLESCRHEADIDMEAMKKDIEYIKASVDEIKNMLRSGR